MSVTHCEFIIWKDECYQVSFFICLGLAFGKTNVNNKLFRQCLQLIMFFIYILHPRRWLDLLFCDLSLFALYVPRQYHLVCGSVDVIQNKKVKRLLYFSKDMHLVFKLKIKNAKYPLIATFLYSKSHLSLAFGEAWNDTGFNDKVIRKKTEFESKTWSSSESRLSLKS